MKRISLLLVLLVVSVWLVGQSFTLNHVEMVASNVAAGGAACSTSDTTLPNDTLLEGFETPTTGWGDPDGNTNRWSVVDTAAYIVMPFDISGYTTGKPDSSCDYGFKVTVPNTDEQYVEWDSTVTNDVDAAAIDVRFWVYFDTITMTGVENHAILNILDGPGAACAFLSIYTNATLSSYALRAGGSAASADLAISLDAWHLVKLHLDTTGASSYLDVDNLYGTTNVFTRYANKDPRYFRFGAPLGVDSSDGGAVMYFDLIAIDHP